MSFAIAKTRNALDDGSVPTDKHGRPEAWCEHCGNEGVVILEGTITIDGQTHGRGSAPCLWCDQGGLRYAGWTAATAIQKGTDHHGGKHTNHHRQLHHVESEYTMFDVLATGAEPRRGERFTPTAEWCREQVEAGCTQRGIMAVVPQSAWPPEWTQQRGELVGALKDTGEVARKRELALRAKNEAERAAS